MQRPLPLVLLSGLVGCASTYSVPPQHAAAFDYFAAPRVIAVAPVQLSEEIPVAEEHLVRIDAEIDSVLRAAGVGVVPSDTYSVAWNAIVDEYGGFFDSETGERDEELFGAARRALFDTLANRHGATATLYPEIVIVMAPYDGGSAEWDGVTKGIRGKGGGFFGFLDRLFAPETIEQGEVVAASISLFIETSDGAELYESQVGIEVVDEFKDGEFHQREDFLAKPDRTLEAIRLALDAILRARAEAPDAALVRSVRVAPEAARADSS